jgi:hypothetical protein
MKNSSIFLNSSILATVYNDFETKMLNKITFFKCQFILDIFLKRKTAVVLQIYNVTKVPIFALCFSFNIFWLLEEGTLFF